MWKRAFSQFLAIGVIALTTACGGLEQPADPAESVSVLEQDGTVCGAPLPPWQYGEGIDPNKATACAEARVNADSVCQSVNGKKCCSHSACDCGVQPYPNDGGWFCFVYYLTLKP